MRFSRKKLLPHCQMWRKVRALKASVEDVVSSYEYSVGAIPLVLGFLLSVHQPFFAGRSRFLTGAECGGAWRKDEAIHKRSSRNGLNGTLLTLGREDETWTWTAMRAIKF